MQRIETVEVDGRVVGFADLGRPDGTPVVWCHGGPGSRLEPLQAVRAAQAHGLRLIGIDRPGYGLSSPQPGRTIAGWTADATAVLERLGIDRFATIGVSTGGAYALALAAKLPERVLAVAVVCGLTDMAWAEARDGMPELGTVTVWNAPDRESALAAAAAVWGEDGTRQPVPERPLPPADLALLHDAEFLEAAMQSASGHWSFGVQGYTDDRRADGHGWAGLDVTKIRCPVVVVHGDADPFVPVAHAHHTAAVVPGAELRVLPDEGHLSVVRHAVPELARVLT